MAAKKQYTIKESLVETYEKSTLGLAKKRMQEAWGKHRKLILTALLITFLVSAFASGLLHSITLKANREIDEITFFGCFYQAFTGIVPFAVTLIIFGLINYFGIKFILSTHKERARDEERNYNVSKEGYYGTAQKMTDEEKEEAFDKGDFKEQKENYIAAEIGDINTLYCMSKNMKKFGGMNGNVVVFGAPGCGKTRCIVLPTIFQTIRRGESLIVTDPKGELYELTSPMARAHGYVTKILNYDQDYLLHSDSVDFLKNVGDNTDIADSLAEIIIANLFKDNKGDFWQDGALNLLTFAILYVTTNTIGMKRTLGSVYELINKNGVSELEDLALMLPEDHVAVSYFNNFKDGPDTVKDSTLSGLGIRLRKLASKAIHNIVSVDDVDLSLPGREKCIYYIAINDQNPEPLSFLVAMTFTQLFSELGVLSKASPGRHLPIRVTMMMDEFYNMGVIPSFDKKIAQLRSRWIDCYVILQSLGQLQELYMDGWERVLECFSTTIVLRVNALETSKYFSEMTGEQTVEDIGKRYNENVADPVKYHDTNYITESHNQRPLYTPHEIRTLDRKHMLVWISTYNVVELERVDYMKHPMCKELRHGSAERHCPKWVLMLSEKDQKRLKVLQEEYESEDEDEIELCEESDFEEPWDDHKQARLEKMIGMQLKYTKKGMYQEGYEDEIEENEKKQDDEDDDKDYEYVENTSVENMFKRAAR